MLRTNLLKRNINNKKDLYFQIIDWSSNDIYKSINNDEEDEEEDENEKKKYNKKRRLVIRGYGVTKEGYSISIHIFNFKPYFYINVPEEWDEKVFKYFKSEVLKNVQEYNHEGLDICKLVQKKDFYGFTNNKLFKYALFKFKSQSSYYGFLKVFREKPINIQRLNQEIDFSKKIYESKVNSIIRFFHNNDIDPSGWLKINKGAYIINNPSKSRCQFDISVDCNQVLKEDLKITPKIVVASFDIECTSCDGAFPKYSREEDRIIQIGTTVYIYGDTECSLKYICTLKKCDPIEGVMLECYDNERELLIGWAKFIERLDPDIMTGYNIWGFDWEYIYERIKMEKCSSIVFRHLNRIKNKDEYKEELTVQDLSSSALGQNILKFINIEGIIQIDLLKVVQRDHKLDSYKLDNVSKVFMNNQKEDLSPKQLFENYRIGSSSKIREIAVYCVKDCILVNELINKLQVITNNMGMSNVCIVPFSYLFTRGQGIKIFSLVAKFCNEEDFIIKDLSLDDIDTNSYEGAIVFVPTPGVYFEPVVVMDYNSLYPSSMIAENISHDSILGYKEYRLIEKNEKQNQIINKTINSTIINQEYELISDTIRHEYENLEGYHYIDIEYDIFQGIDNDKRKVGYKVCRFAERDDGEKSVLPRILRKLLTARKDTRKIMKYSTVQLKDGETYSGLLEEKDNIYQVNNLDLGKKIFDKSDVESIKITNNEFQIAVLDGLQLAYKVTCNSLYGQVGASTSPICYKELAACTTATGRKMVITARDLTLEKFEGSKLTYGDSVAYYTPIYVKINNQVILTTIEDLSERFNTSKWQTCTTPGKETKEYFELTNIGQEQDFNYDIQTWTEKGWTKLYRIIRHKLISSKKMYRIISPIGIVDVTDDHSLLDINGTSISPEEILKSMNTKQNQVQLLNKYMNEEISNKEEIKNKNNNSLNNQIDSALVYHELYKNNNKSIINYKDDNYEIIEENKNSLHNQQNIQIIDITEEYGKTKYVYDLTTENHHFAAGIGNLIVHNTDSIFVNFSDTIKLRNPGKELTEKDLLAESIVIGEEAASHINSHMKAPQNIEYEKTFWPFCIFSKKRYFGNKYEFDLDKYKQTSMGIVLKRRDNAPIVKTIYGGVIDIILNKRNVEDSKLYFKKAVKDLLNGNVDISQLVISKTVRTDYSNPTLIAHKVLADRMGERDPGNKPQSNDRIPYCFIESSNLKCKICDSKVNPDKCKCTTCMGIFCYYHLGNHTQSCKEICRFCRTEEKLERCNTCTGYYCKPCFKKHKLRTDKYKIQHHDKCKKQLASKLLQGDTIENPQYINEQKLKIDYNYYLTNQIEKPVFQIFELVMKNPAKIIEDAVREQKNKKSGNASIKQWFSAMNKTANPSSTSTSTSINKTDNIETSILKKKIDYNEGDDDDNLLEGFEEEVKDLDNIEEN